MRSQKKELYLMIGPLPLENAERVTGVQMAFSVFVSSLKNDEKRSFIVINSAGGVQAHSIGRFNPWRVFGLLKSVIQAILYMPKIQHLYLIVSSSLGGFLKDSILIWLAAIGQKRIVIHLHGGGYRNFYDNLSVGKQKFVRLTLNQVEQVIVLGEALREQFYFLDDTSKIEVVSNGVPELVHPESFKAKKLDQNNGVIELLYLSNLIVSKGYWDVLESCNILHNELHIPIKCHFAGAFAQINMQSDRELFNTVQAARSSFFSRITEWNLDDVVVYHGLVRGKRKKELLLRSHLFVLPTYYEWEGQPLSIIEAMACGIPVITTEQKAIPDMVENGTNGVFVRSKSPQDIARAVMWFNENPEEYRHYSQRSFQRYQEQFTEQAYLRRLTEIVID